MKKPIAVLEITGREALSTTVTASLRRMMQNSTCVEGRCPHCSKYNYDMSVGDNICLRCGEDIHIALPGGGA